MAGGPEDELSAPEGEQLAQRAPQRRERRLRAHAGGDVGEPPLGERAQAARGGEREGVRDGPHVGGVARGLLDPRGGRALERGAVQRGLDERRIGLEQVHDRPLLRQIGRGAREVRASREHEAGDREGSEPVQCRARPHALRLVEAHLHASANARELHAGGLELGERVVEQRRSRGPRVQRAYARARERVHDLREDRLGPWRERTAPCPRERPVQRLLHERAREAVEHVEARERGVPTERAEPVRERGGRDRVGRRDPLSLRAEVPDGLEQHDLGGVVGAALPHGLVERRLRHARGVARKRVEATKREGHEISANPRLARDRRDRSRRARPREHARARAGALRCAGAPARGSLRTRPARRRRRPPRAPTRRRRS